MKISISVPSRFWAFSLAKHLLEHGHLHCLVTSYPVWEVKKYGIPASKVRTIVSKEIMQRLYKKITGKYPTSVFLNNWFDRIASHKLPSNSDIYIIWAGFGSHSIQRLRKKNPNAIFIIERGSTHIQVQNELLKIFKKTKEPINPEVIKKELIEYELANFIALGSSFAKKSFLEKGIPEKKIFVNNYGVDLSKFNLSLSLNNAGRNENSVFTIGYVGSIDKRKNVSGLINAVESIVKEGFEIRLILVGSHNQEEVPAVLLDRPFIEYRGVLPEDKLYKAYSDMDVFVLNSIEDGFGMVILQAMAMGVVPVTTYNTGGPDVIEDGVNGFLIPVLDDAVLADRIKILMNSAELRKAMGKAAMQTTLKGFSWEEYGNRAIEFYKSIMQQNNSEESKRSH
ncbi:MAG TPA: glycosyltransferase family 4 protein [Puia sp.]|nr:glycosyltransferase family 4 protein [Puia sp.]